MREQRGCCGDGIEVVAVSAEYDKAGRKRFERELNASNQAIRTIETTYDALGRVQTIGTYPGQSSEWVYWGKVEYHYDTKGRLWREVYYKYGWYPISYVLYTYYGSEEPSQQGFLKEIEYGYYWEDPEVPEQAVNTFRYRYDLLRRVVWSEEELSGDEFHYSYTPSGRIGSESRTGDIAYHRVYSYHLDGSRDWVLREDGLHGASLDVYHYDSASGRLERVEGSDGTHRFG